MTCKSSVTDPIPKYWKVTLNEKNPHKAYITTSFIGVVANNVVDVCAAVLEKKPEATIVSITHEGPVNILAV